MRRFRGFTLTELMVALAVIGILVAVVTPAIMKNRPNKDKMMIKKSFYTVERVVESLINDENLYPDMRDLCPPDAITTEDEYCAYGFDYTNAATFDGYVYSGDYKFAALFKDRLNVKNNDSTECTGDAKSNIGSEGDNFCTIFYTSDGIKWNLTGTKGAWTSKKDKVGTFDSECGDSSGYAGCGKIIIDVDSSNGETLCSNENEDCDTYEVQILANGKLRINPEHERAVNYATINTSIKDN